MKIESLCTAEISENCIKVHHNSVDLTVADAIAAILPDLTKSVQALKDGRFRAGSRIVVGYGVDRSHVSKR